MEQWNGKRLSRVAAESVKKFDSYASDEAYIAAANASIAERTKYGVRTVPTPTYVARLYSWSNGYAKWSPYQWVIDPMHIEDWMLRLDANIILLPALPDKRTDALVKLFDPLPLFANSFEYVHQQKRSENPITATEVDMAPFQIVVPDDGIRRRK